MRRSNVAETRRYRTRLHRRDHPGPGQVPRLDRRFLGHPVLPPARLHAGLHHRARLRRAAQGRVRQAPRQVRRALDRSGGLAQGLDEGHQGDARPRAHLPDRGRPGAQGREPLRHDASGPRRGLHGAYRDHRAQFRRDPAGDRLDAAHRRVPRRHPGQLEAGRRRHHRARGDRRRGQDQVPQGLEGAQALPAPHPAAQVTVTLKGADVLVIGAGCVGANVAYRLAERGATVTVLDAGSPGDGTSGASFAWTNSFSKTPRDYHDLNVAGMEEHAALSKELGGGWLHQDGALAWEETPAGLARLDQAVERLTGWGYPVERISPGHARELEPDLRIGDAVPHVVWTPGEGYVEAVPFVAALLAAAARRGARILPGRRVTGVIRSGARVQGVSVEGGDRLSAGVVVDCAGAATDEIA